MGEDRRILRQRGVGVALCPRSNRITNTGKDAPVREYLEEGNLVSVGTDSLSSTPTLDLLDDVSMLYDLAREQGYASDDLTHRLIRMMTLGGAASMGMHVGRNRIGQINAGALADFGVLRHPRRHIISGRHRRNAGNTGEARRRHEPSHGDIRARSLQQRLVTPLT